MERSQTDQRATDVAAGAGSALGGECPVEKSQSIFGAVIFAHFSFSFLSPLSFAVRLIFFLFL